MTHDSGLLFWATLYRSYLFQLRRMRGELVRSSEELCTVNLRDYDVTLKRLPFSVRRLRHQQSVRCSEHSVQAQHSTPNTYSVQPPMMFVRRLSDERQRTEVALRPM